MSRTAIGQVTLLDVSDGESIQGDPGLRTVQGSLYYESTTENAPEAPNEGIYTFSTGLVTDESINDNGTTDVWKNTPNTQDPTSSNTYYIVRYSGIESEANSTTVTISCGTVFEHTSFTGVVTFSDGNFAKDNTTITEIDGGNLKTGSIKANTLTIGNVTLEEGSSILKLYEDCLKIFSNGVLRVKLGNLGNAEDET